MMDKAWKKDEREVAKMVSKWIGVATRRNRANENSDDRELNSDVDAICPRLEHGQSKGITFEVARRAYGITTLYKALNKAKRFASKLHPTIVLLKGTQGHAEYALCHAKDFPAIYDRAVLQRPEQNSRPSIMYSDLRLPGTVTQKMEQCERYAATKSTTPVLALRTTNKQQIFVFREEDITLW